MRNFERSATVRRRSARYAPVPVSKKNTGAQKYVIQRVRKRPALALERSVGFWPGMPKKSRV